MDNSVAAQDLDLGDCLAEDIDFKRHLKKVALTCFEMPPCLVSACINSTTPQVVKCRGLLSLI